MTREPGDLPGAVVLRSAGVRRAIRGFPKETAMSPRVRGRAVSTQGPLHEPDLPKNVRPVVNEEAVVRFSVPSPTFLLLLALAAPISAGAQGLANGQAAPPDEAGEAAANGAGGIVVTAIRSPLPARQVAASVTVLTAQQIQRDQETSVGDILARTPGVNVTRNGGPGETTSVFIRGAESDETVALVDGVKVNDPTDPGTGYDFANLITGDIARIEVLRGPQSTLYGSEAIGGVVNIVTADATRPLEANLQAEGGSYGTSYANGAIGGKEDGYDWRLSGYSDETKGVPCFDEALGGRRPCAYHTAGFSGRFRYDLTPDLQLDQRVYYTWSRSDFDGYDTPSFNFGDDSEYGHTQQMVDYTGLNLSLFGGRLNNRLAFEYDDIDHKNEDPGQPGATVTFVGLGRTETVEYEGSFAVAPGYQAVFGAQSERSSLVADSPAYQPAPTRANDTINSGYGLITAKPLETLTLSGGVRYDDHSAYGGHTTGQASVAWSLNQGNTILRASYGQGFKAPSLYQLYSEYGNLALRPEQADGWDAGIEQRLLDGRLDLQATYFDRTTQDLIEFVSCYGTGAPGETQQMCDRYAAVGGYYANVDKARAQGVELQGNWRLTDRMDLSASYTYDDAVDRSAGSPSDGLQLPRRPKNTANLTAGYVWPIKLRTDLAVRYAGESFDDAVHTYPLKSYALLDLRLSYPLRKNLELYGRIENLTDQRYETTYQYGTLRRAAYAGVRASF